MLLVIGRCNVSKRRREIPSDLLDDRMLSLQQVPALDGVHVNTVLREIARGNLKATRLSTNRVGIRTSDWRAAREIDSA